MYRYFFNSLITCIFCLFSIQVFAADTPSPATKSTTLNPSPVTQATPVSNPSPTKEIKETKGAAPAAASSSAESPAPAANPSPVAGAKDASTIDTIKASCVKEWVKLGADSTDKDAYKAFGEKYCGCASKQPLNNDDDIKKAARLCMTRVLLTAIMDDLESSPGLAKLNSDIIEKACQNKLNIIYPKMDPEGQKVTYAYCKCAAPKLADIAKNEGNYNDQQWEDKIHDIAGGCSGMEQKP